VKLEDYRYGMSGDAQRAMGAAGVHARPFSHEVESLIEQSAGDLRIVVNGRAQEPIATGKTMPRSTRAPCSSSPVKNRSLPRSDTVHEIDATNQKECAFTQGCQRCAHSLSLRLARLVAR
jgi:hypothetical protein